MSPFCPINTEELLAIERVVDYSSSPLAARMDLGQTGIGSNPYLRDFLGLSEIGLKPNLEHLQTLVTKYGWGLLTESAIDLISQATTVLQHRIVGVFSGRGYCEAQLRDRGFDVIAYDTISHDRSWIEVQKGGVEEIRRHADRALFLSYPPARSANGTLLAKLALQLYLECGGREVIAITPREPEHPFGAGFEFDCLLRCATSRNLLALPSWNDLPELSSLQPLCDSLQPILHVAHFSDNWRGAISTLA